jgi:hypothetical protein
MVVDCCRRVACSFGWIDVLERPDNGQTGIRRQREATDIHRYPGKGISLCRLKGPKVQRNFSAKQTTKALVSLCSVAN